MPPFECVGDELEEAEAYMLTRADKRREFIAKDYMINEKRRRKWLV